MELLALHNSIKKPPRSDERDGELFCGTDKLSFYFYCYGTSSTGQVQIVSAEEKKTNIVTLSGTGHTLTVGDLTIRAQWVSGWRYTMSSTSGTYTVLTANSIDTEASTEHTLSPGSPVVLYGVQTYYGFVY